MKKAAVFICFILIICVLGGVLAGCSGGTKSSYKIDVASAAGYDEAEFVASLQEEKGRRRKQFQDSLFFSKSAKRRGVFARYPQTDDGRGASF